MTYSKLLKDMRPNLGFLVLQGLIGRRKGMLLLLPKCYQHRFPALFDVMHNENSKTVWMKGGFVRCTGTVRYPHRVTVGEKMARVGKPLSH